MGKTIEQIRIEKTSNVLRAQSSKMRFGPNPLITIPARGFWKRRISRPDKSAHSITRQRVKKTCCTSGGNHKRTLTCEAAQAPNCKAAPRLALDAGQVGAAASRDLDRGRQAAKPRDHALLEG